ncbi:GntR family transcriptional regulator [Spiractinospora alimapuensis]|uniref:GntR family transcriptional regulator n=1 Tax=Spiractinospora alimapuensis TaxID=2820884 RepID=UPI001F22BAFB|nr:GntR family transcriptional regulator [Spiractinospora alimapuensis]QVQ52357.1 GntR family transcriptional regulator [Spiractinospora alimapuensis]
MSDDSSPRIPLDPPSVVRMAQESVRHSILSGDIEAGARLIEERLCARLGISRPPLREALRLLEREGLVVARPRRGWQVVTLTGGDVHELVTLRSGLERLAVQWGVPVRDHALLEDARAALESMERCAATQDRAGLTAAGRAFHIGLVAVAGNRRLVDTYTSVVDQLSLCMARNLYVRERLYEDLPTHVRRHRHLLELVEAGSPDAVLAELAVHGERSFLGESSEDAP